MSREQWGHGYYTGYKDALKTTASFYDWIVNIYADEDSPVGDLARDIKEESEWPNPNNDRPKFWKEKFPCNKQSYNKIRSHLFAYGACRDAMDAFEEAWKMYKSYSKRNQ